MFRSLSLAALASTAALVLVATPAQAGQLFHDRFHDAGSEVFDDFCGIDGVGHTVNVILLASSRGVSVRQ